MCGIVGGHGECDEPTARALRDALQHRGPDGEGWVQFGRVWLGHRRLSIIDLTGGNQPLFNEDRSIAVVFNGEIYNHRELRRRLESLGHRFATTCDTEVLVHAYESHGPAMVDHLVGMFAFVLYDARENFFFGARDRLGKKPLYLWQTPTAGPLEFAFASEASALMSHPEIRATTALRWSSVRDYLLNDYVIGRDSIYAHVQRLEPGHRFTYQPNSRALHIERYSDPLDSLDPRSSPNHPPSHQTLATSDPVQELETKLRQAVERRLMADVPLGCFLSGGIDSSLIVGLARQFLGELDTFTIGFDDPSFDESSSAREVADYWQTRHHVERLSLADLEKDLPQAAARMDEPLADPSILPTARLARLAASSIRVALSGDGCDELFAGYDTYRALAFAEGYSRLVPDGVHRWIRAAAGWLPISDRNLSYRFVTERFLRGAGVPGSRRLPIWMGSCEPATLARLFPDRIRTLCEEDLYLRQEEVDLRLQHRDRITRATGFHERFYLPDDILVKVDRASMWHSLEVRCPFLDQDLVTWVNALSSEFKYRDGRSKVLLRRLATRTIGARSGGRPLVPPRIVRRKKKGFGVPISRWFRQPRDWMRAALLEPWPAPLDEIRRAEIGSMLEKHQRRQAEFGKELWALLVLSLWARHHWAGPGRSPHWSE